MDNTGTVYTIGGFSHPGLNAGVDRFSSRPNASNHLDHYYEPTGRLAIPVLTLHTTGDPDTPFFHEAALASTVAGAGRSEHLVQRSFDRLGHCNFTAEEDVEALVDLVTWIDAGIKPAP